MHFIMTNKVRLRRFLSYIAIVTQSQLNLLRPHIFLDELTIDEIAQSLSLSREAVKGRLHRARGLIRDYLTG